MAGPGVRAPLHRAMIAIGQLFFRVRNALFPIVFIAIAAASRPRPFGGSSQLDAWCDAVGLCIALAGQTLRAIVIGLAYIRRGGKDKKIYAETLVQNGFFAHSRNPLYVGNMLVFLGLFVMLNSPLGYFVGVSFFAFAYFAIVLAEEDFLERQFGDEYRRYCRRVNRFVPSLAGLTATMRGMRFDWRRLVRKEYGSTFTWTTTALALLLWERFWNDAPAAANLVPVVLAAWLALIGGYLLARYLKKTGRLRST